MRTTPRRSTTRSPDVKLATISLVKPLGGFGAGLHRALSIPELAHGVFHGRGHERRLRAGFSIVAGGGARGGEDAQDGVGEHCRQRGDNRSQAEEEVAALGQGSR